MKNLKLIVTDLDKTFLRNDRTISLRNLKALQICREKGLRIAVATARAEWSCEDYVRQIAPDYLISSAGALVRYGETFLQQRLLSAETADALLACARKEPAVTSMTAESMRAYYTARPPLPEGEEPRGKQIIRTDFSLPLQTELIKCTFHIESPEAAEQIAAANPACSMLRFSGENVYRFAHPLTEKLDAVQAVARHMGISLEQVMAFGDDWSDYRLLKSCGCGVAMGNAQPAILEEIKYRTVSNEEDGVAVFLEKMFA